MNKKHSNNLGKDTIQQSSTSSTQKILDIHTYMLQTAAPAAATTNTTVV